MSPSRPQLSDLYDALLAHFGPQHWWPGQSPFEVMVGAVLTQNTNWTNVERAIANLRAADCLDPFAIDALSPARLAELIRPAGYFNIKAKRLKNLVHWFCETCNGDVEAARAFTAPRLREELLSIPGVGRETADSIILYALDKLTFVVDTYTHRILTRHELIEREADYEAIKEYCEAHLPADLAVYNECHALFVAVGKHHCKPRPRCETCPLRSLPHSIEEA